MSKMWHFLERKKISFSVTKGLVAVLQKLNHMTNNNEGGGGDKDIQWVVG